MAFAGAAAEVFSQSDRIMFAFNFRSWSFIMRWMGFGQRKISSNLRCVIQCSVAVVFVVDISISADRYSVVHAFDRQITFRRLKSETTLKRVATAGCYGCCNQSQHDDTKLLSFVAFTVVCACVVIIIKKMNGFASVRR